MNRFASPVKIARDRCQSCFYDFFLLPWPIHGCAVALFAAFNARSAKGLTQKWFNPPAHGAASFVASGFRKLLPWQLFCATKCHGMCLLKKMRPGAMD
jgi:hypothetical protein